MLTAPLVAIIRALKAMLANLEGRMIGTVEDAMHPITKIVRKLERVEAHSDTAADKARDEAASASLRAAAHSDTAAAASTAVASLKATFGAR